MILEVGVMQRYIGMIVRTLFAIVGVFCVSRIDLRADAVSVCARESMANVGGGGGVVTSEFGNCAR